MLKAIPYFILYVFSSSCALAAEDQPALYGSWASIMPPVLAILFALITRRVLPALFLGIWLGAWLIQGMDFQGLWLGLLDAFQVYVTAALADPDHAAVILFSLMIGGMVGIISRNGGMQGIVHLVVRWADSARHAMLTTTAMGLAIFFDDYSNTLVVGNTMRQVTDTMRVSRAKLAYLVDTTAAPVACIAVVTTWVGYEVGLIDQAIGQIESLNEPAYLVYLRSIPYSFYPILAIAFAFMVSGSGRDFGPMLKVERLARRDGITAPTPGADEGREPDYAPILPIEGKPQRAMNALLPVGVLVVAVIVGLYATGRDALGEAEPRLSDIIGAADAYKALMWASLVSMLTAAVLSMAQRILTLEQVMDSWFRGLRAMLKAIIILVLAWSLGQIAELLGTAQFLVGVLGETLPAWSLPALVFVIAAATGFGTGSSWGAMAILVPLVIPLTWAVMQHQGLAGAEHMHLLYSALAAVLAGSVWGDHCSPISDTTILSSLASGCDHVEHVRTQMPYALLVGLVAVFGGSIPVALGLAWWLALPICCLALATILWSFGRTSEPT